MQQVFHVNSYEERLKQIVEALVANRRKQNEALTWRALTEIEAGALAELRKQRDLNPRTVELFIAGCRLVRYPRSNDIVDFGKSNVRSVTASLIHDAYRQAH